MEFSIVIIQFNVYIYIYNFSNICAYIIFTNVQELVQKTCELFMNIQF